MEEVGTEFGMKPQTLSNYEKGKRSIDIDILFELAQFYDVSIDYLFGLSDNSTPQRDAFVADELETIGFFPMKQLIYFGEIAVLWNF